ncbi:lysophospholipid acyltransferase family protein [Spirulina sp. CCNP1310]|uniref:lysophospholipid acyltransferase family protein n=1 Tax=Spirulina sp. CCNP1310 TaxID=3110249 RepID=UPI002B203EF4|nr:lysophospholipid acyltransferase family protein [Spirulina sp. CCNP1310]MEA5420764.1 lysophospholipid acyltransferase family protein [Spirulina sp. CCNP1310]
MPSVETTSDALETRRDREPLISLALYSGLKWSIIAPVFNTYFRGRIHNVERVPRSGPLIVVANHASHFDPPLLATALQRPVAFMAKEELFKIPVFGPGIALYGAYPVNRKSADRSAIKSAIKSSHQGWAVGIFVQGTRTPDGRVTEPKLGAAMLAAKLNAPLLPASLWGTEKILVKGSAWPQSVPVTIRVGEVLPPPASSKRADLEATTALCTEKINALHGLGR